MMSRHFLVRILFPSLFVGIVGCASAVADHAGDANAVVVIPEPTSTQRCAGELVIDSATIISADPEFTDSATYLADQLANSAGIAIQDTGSPTGGNISLQHVDTGVLPKEGYTLQVSSEQITIRASDNAGAFYAVQTLLQLMPPAIYGVEPQSTVTIPCVAIEDAPRFEWRGFMLDVSRHFFDAERVKLIVEQMAMHKLNRLHLHLTDDPGWRVELTQFPKLTEIGAIGNISDQDAPARYFTRKDIEDIVSYAKLHHITVIPEIDMPGHGGAAARAYPEHFDGLITWNIGRDETVEFAESVLSEVIDIFPGPYVHFGGDELRNHVLETLPDVQDAMARHGFTSIHELEALFDRTIADFLISKGKTPIAWDEVSAYGLDDQTIVQWWRSHKPETMKLAAEAGHRIVVSPSDHLYLDYAQAPGEPGAPWEGNDNGPNSLELIYGWDPIPKDFSEDERQLVLGVEAALWTEFIQTERYMEYMMFPRLSALSELAWAEEGTREDFEYFKEKLEVQFERYEALGLNYRKPSDWYPVAENVAEYLRN